MGTIPKRPPMFNDGNYWHQGNGSKTDRRAEDSENGARILLPRVAEESWWFQSQYSQRVGREGLRWQPSSNWSTLLSVFLSSHTAPPLHPVAEPSPSWTPVSKQYRHTDTHIHTALQTRTLLHIVDSSSICPWPSSLRKYKSMAMARNRQRNFNIIRQNAIELLPGQTRGQRTTWDS